MTGASRGTCRSTQIVTGAVIVALGVALAGLQIFGWQSLELGRLWPIIVVGMGVNKLVQRWQARDGEAGWGVALILMGMVIWLHTEHILPVGRSWPLLFVAHGIGLLLNGAGFGAHRGEVRDGQ